MVGIARATRSSHNPDKSPQKQLDSKKRKRVSDSADEPAQKLQRTDAPPYAATIPIDPDHAAQILHVLQMIDQQRLLDRVYPLEQSASAAPSYSLRTLLQNSQDHTLATLRVAVNNLAPISLHPRAQTPAPAAQQQRFCDIALDLLAQASFHPVSLNVESLLPAEPTPADEDLRYVNKRYALMQHLPGGDFWTSANIPLSSEPGSADLKDLPTGHAELVAVFPGPSDAPFDPTSVPKLGDYARTPIPSYEVRPRNAGALPVNRRVTCGSFLDYGVDASFAPTWVNDGREVGMRQMAEVYAQREQRYLERLAARQRALEAAREMQEEAAAAKSQPEPQADAELEMVTAPPPDANVDVDALQDILAPEEIDSLKAVLGSLELENAVQELLTRNRRALQRLGQLQTERLRAPGGRTSTVREGDEEWDVANGILDSLTLLASLRPRSSAHPVAPLIPPPTVLHALQQTLPRAPQPGWHGTLSSRVPALRDNSTVKVRPGVPAVAPTPVPPPASIQPVMPTPVGGGYYPQQQQRVLPAAPGAGGQYRYNASRAPGTPQQQYAAQGQTVYPGQGQIPQQQPGNYYGNAVPYGGGYGAGGSWYGASGSGSGAYTPQQQQAQQGTATPGGYGQQQQPQTPAPGYGAYMGAAGGGGSGVSTPVGMNLGGGGGKAVANTVLGKLGPLGGGGAALSGWSAGAGMQTPPVLPPHLRAAVAAATVTGGGGGGSGYHTPS
ncbi:hypothetical protein B0H16DRAFT_4036 [Mycena metata]|uniref:Uncharacterized protein n=1 Tax=Mycena metata TaxID=1033252 RepID=A0AAD7KHA0_9AGAR|nr:hypothetical protein B0H16DRAFT_4036 [Mycena metata]